ncbi:MULTISPECIES: hypothetical protein [Streptomyces]|uniref:Integral membrane protein n=1 Tax=Streptomyces lienomycini TaxID=284035 RepID=A0ABV9WWB9_9ACTN|nr:MULTISPECIES: hypothetical protein [Streptomyces]
MSSTRVPPGARGSYPAPGLALTPGHVRNQALTVIAIPFVLIVVLAVVLATAGPDDGSPSTDGLYGSGALPDWGAGATDDATSDDGYADDGTDPDSGGLTGEDAYPWDTGTTDEATDGTYDDTYDGTTDDTATDDTATEDAEDPATGADGPEATVTAYFEAINDQDYATAWELGGKNLDPDYDHFVAGFATTQRDEITVTGTSGDDVSITIVAWQTDGTQTTYEGTYTVGDGVITSADMREGN